MIAKRGNRPEGKTDESYTDEMFFRGISPMRSGFAITIKVFFLGGHERERTEPERANVRSCHDGSYAGVLPLATVCGGASLKAGDP